jgi:ATP-binding cassette subfamily G (WHITE) protein 2 (SNQ2)
MLTGHDRAEFMLDVIGAGATATSTIDWHAVWEKSPEATATMTDIRRIHNEGRNRPAVETKLHTEYSTSWIHQTSVVARRSAAAVWRDPTYVTAKLVLNIAAGLFIGFTFWKTPSTLQGIQNKLFSIFVTLILSVPGAQQLQIPFIANRAIYEIRERPSKMYSWSAWVTAQILVEIPWNMFGGMLLFFCWYWTVGFPTERAGYTFFILTVLTPFYYTTIGQAVAAAAPTVDVAALLFTSSFSFVLIL